MTESIYEFVLLQLETTKGHWSKVSRDTGISKRTIEKIARQEVENPGIRHIETLADYFRALRAKKKPANNPSSPANSLTAA